MDESSLQTFSEVYCLLKFFPKLYIDKLPKKFLSIVEQNKAPQYFIEVDTMKPLEEQKISKETKNILIVLKYNYWSDENEKKEIIKRLNENEKEYERILREKYNPDNIFKNKATKVEKVENTVAMVKYKESLFTKIKNWFKHIF